MGELCKLGGLGLVLQFGCVGRVGVSWVSRCFGPFLASQDALEVMRVTHSLSN